MTLSPEEDLRSENAELRARLDEAEQTIEAIRTGQVDALVVSGAQGEQVFTLAGAEHIYRIVLETMNEGALTVARDGTICFSNHRFSQLVRAPLEEVVGRKVTEFVASAQEATLNRVVAQAQSGPARGRMVMRAKDGELIHVQLAANPLPAGAGDTICLIVSDLTELEAQARSVAALRQQQQALEQREHELRLTAAELERSNRDLEQFAYVASHDLQEPLRQVRAFVQLLCDRHADKLEGKAAEYMFYISDGASRMSDLVQDLLTYSRAGASQQNRKPVSAKRVLQRAVFDLQTSQAEAKATITHDELPTVKADETQLGQVFLNLIANAIKFRREEVQPIIHVGCRRDGRNWRFWVKDNGIGIAPEHQQKVFVIFQRLHDRTKYPGTGVGLAICRKIVESHGGKIWVESKEGEGSTFFFTIPEGGQ